MCTSSRSGTSEHTAAIDKVQNANSLALRDRIEPYRSGLKADDTVSYMIVESNCTLGSTGLISANYIGLVPEYPPR